MRNPNETPGIREAEIILHRLWREASDGNASLWVVMALYNAFSYLSFGDAALIAKRAVCKERGLDPSSYMAMQIVWPRLKDK